MGPTQQPPVRWMGAEIWRLLLNLDALFEGCEMETSSQPKGYTRVVIGAIAVGQLQPTPQI